MKLKTERDLSYIDPVTVEFFQNNGTSSISVILLTNGRKEGQTNGREFNTSLSEVIKVFYCARRKIVDCRCQNKNTIKH